MKHLYRSEKNKVIAGIMGGLGEYFETDPVIFRAGYIVLACITGLFPAVVAYIICMFVIPKKSEAEIKSEK